MQSIPSCRHKLENETRSTCTPLVHVLRQQRYAGGTRNRRNISAAIQVGRVNCLSPSTAAAEDAYVPKIVRLPGGRCMLDRLGSQYDARCTRVTRLCLRSARVSACDRTPHRSWEIVGKSVLEVSRRLRIRVGQWVSSTPDSSRA